jgi:EmrB/QacA subfamily drug resistance transporter
VTSFPETPPRRSAQLRLLFVALVVITMLSALDATIVATALPSIVADLGGERQIGWVFASYTLAMTVSMPVFGRIGDLQGRRPLYLGCIAGFVLASVMCGFAADLAQLIALRFVQGLAGGGLLVLGQAVVADAVPARERARFLAPIASVFAIASVVSPLLGGGLTDTVGWRWIFWVNAPVGGIALVLAVLSVPRTRPEPTGERLDLPGAFLLAVWTTGTVLVAAWGGTTLAWTSPALLATAGVAVLTFAAFVRRSLRHPHPIVPVALFRDRTTVVCSALGFVVGFAVFGMVGYLPGLMQAAFGLPATVAGTVILPLVLGLLGASIWAGRRIARTGRYRWYPVAGCAVAAAGLAVLAVVQPSSPEVLVGVGAGLVGLGVGCFNQVTTVAVQDAVPPRLVGTATSTVALVRELGVTVGAATLGGLLASRLLGALGPLQSLARLSPEQLHAQSEVMQQTYAQAYLSAFTPLMAALAVLFVAALAVSFLLPDRPLGQDVPGRQPEHGAGEALDAAEVFAVGEAGSRHDRAS